MNVRDFFSYLLIPIYKPKQGLCRLLTDRLALGYALLSLLLMGVLYTIAVYIGYRNGFGAVLTPFLSISAEEYYLWETFFVVPAFFVFTIVFAGTARLLAVPFKGAGRFENNFAIYSIATVLPTLLLFWLPEASIMILFPDDRATPLGGFAMLPPMVDAIRQIVAALWPLVITALGIRISEKVSFGAAGVITVIAFIPTAVLMITFIR